MTECNDVVEKIPLPRMESSNGLADADKLCMVEREGSRKIVVFFAWVRSVANNAVLLFFGRW